MTDFMTRVALVGAAVSFAAWVFLVNRRWIARVPEFVSRIPRSSLSVFLAFAIVATSVAQKGGTNNVIRLDGIVQGLDQLEPWGGNNGN